MPSAPEVRVVSVAVAVSAAVAYDFARRMENLPRWASGLAAGIAEVDGEWIAEAPMGRVQVRMAPPNPHGVLDHDVTLPDGTTVHNAMRVSPAGDGCVVTFVLVRTPGTSDAMYAADAAHVERDLHALRALLESGAA